MNIWMLSHTYLPAMGGIENYLRETGRLLIKRGYRVGIICRRTDPALPEEEEIEGIRVIRHPDFSVPKNRLLVKPRYLTSRIAHWLGTTGYLNRGWALCRYPHYQCALSSLPTPPPSLYIPASVWPVLASRMISPGRVKEKFFARWWKRQMYTMERAALEKASRVIVFSRNMSDQIREAYGIDRERIQITPPGVDQTRFSPRLPDRRLLEELRLKSSVPVILYLGRLSPEKNLLFLLKSLSPFLLSRRASLLLAGNGPMKPALEKEVSRMGVSSSVRFTGPIREPERYYSLAQIFVSVSRYESFGQTLLEAMASGLPVITLKDAPPAIRVSSGEIVEDGKTGFTIPENSSSLREKINLLLDSEVLRHKLGQRGRDLCRARFSWEKHVSELIQIAEMEGRRP